MNANLKITACLLASVLSLSALPATVTAAANASEKVGITTKGEDLLTVTHYEYTLADHGLKESTPEAEIIIDPADMPEPVIMNFSSLLDLGNSYALLCDHPNDLEGSFNFVKLDDGTKCLRINYDVCEEQKNWSPFRMMTQFMKNDVVKDTHRYMRITYMTNDPQSATITLTNNEDPTKVVTLVNDTSVSRGRFVTSNAVNISANDAAERFKTGGYCTFEYNSLNTNGAIYIKEIALFATKQQAYDYYGDYEVEEAPRYSEMTFAVDGATGIVRRDDPTWGTSVDNTKTGAADITYSAYTNLKCNYMAKIKFASKTSIDPSHIYVRALYAAKNPAGVKNASMYIHADGTGTETIRLVENIADTNGKFVLSDTALMAPKMAQRIMSPTHCSLYVNTQKDGGVYSLKALYFFASKEDADRFTYVSGERAVDINGNDIKNYKIVVAEDASTRQMEAAKELVGHVKSLTGFELPVIRDSKPAGEYEILLGVSNRQISSDVYSELVNMDGDSLNRFACRIDGKNVALIAVSSGNLTDCMDNFLTGCLYKNSSNAPAKISITDSFSFVGSSGTLKRYEWDDVQNVASPDVLTVNFDTDEGYFTEESGHSDFKVVNGALEASAEDFAASYVQVYEKNAVIGAKLTYSGAKTDSELGVMLRCTAPEAYVKAGYDFGKAAWYIEYREGLDFYTQRVAEYPMAITENTPYSVVFTLNGKSAALSVNGTQIIKNAEVAHVTPGKPGVFAESVKATFDDVSITLLSGEGIIMRNVVHTKLPVESYIEGGSVYEMNDGSLTYMHSSGITFKSIDSGKTWTSADTWTKPSTNMHVNYYRLNNGEWLTVYMLRVNGVDSLISRTSSDDGKTWVDGGVICTLYYDKHDKAVAHNMNDKIFQSATTDRIFYAQNYDCSSNPMDGFRTVFGEFYYSDDNGKTWTKSETATYEMEGNQRHDRFGESKIIECDDGTLRVYNSWNCYGCVVYSESHDNGVTWGPVVKIPELSCARSSMQLVRDPYADNDTTYYMVWVYDSPVNNTSGMPRSRLALAYSENGKDWTHVGDLWRWETAYRENNAMINHIVDPFVSVTKDYVIAGSGLTEHMMTSADNTTHLAQRQHIWSVPKASLPEGTPMFQPECLGTFTDVNVTHSYYDAVKFVTEKGLFNGTSATTFSPSTTMTRSMFVTVLGRLDGADMSKYTTPTFKDVVAGQWYTSYVEWAAANNIVNGIGNGLYGIDGAVTVEQICLMLSRYNGAKAAATASGKTVADFTDASSISAWAADGVKWAVENGVYAGQGGKLNPTAPASRALVATMFHNYVNVYGK